jgi:hypothetical protein
MQRRLTYAYSQSKILMTRITNKCRVFVLTFLGLRRRSKNGSRGRRDSKPQRSSMSVKLSNILLCNIISYVDIVDKTIENPFVGEHQEDHYNSQSGFEFINKGFKGIDEMNGITVSFW